MIGEALPSETRHSAFMQDDFANVQRGFSQRLIQARLYRNIQTQAALARALGLRDADRVSLWETGQGYPRPMVMYRLVKLLGVTSDWLFFGDPSGLQRGVYEDLIIRKLHMDNADQS